MNAQASFAGDLQDQVDTAEARMHRLLDKVDAWAFMNQMVDIPPADRGSEIAVGAGLDTLDLRCENIGTVIWATGFKPHYPWLDLPVKDERGGLIHDGGVLPTPGGYVMGLPFMRRRKSTFIDGAGDDARDIVTHLAAHLDAAAGSMAAAS